MYDIPFDKTIQNVVILQAHTSAYVDTEKEKLVFLTRQLEVLLQKQFSMNDYCFALQSYPKGNYEQLRDFLVLPCKCKLQYITSSIDKDQVLRETFDKVQTLQQKNVFLLVDEVQIRPTVSFSGNVVIGTVRFVLSIVRSGADPSCVQLIIVEELKAIMTSQDKGPLLEIIAWLQAANDTVRPVLVSRRSCLQELSGGNALFRCQLRLITRSETGAAVMREYDRTSLPRVMISGFPPPRSFSNGPNYGGSLPPKPVAHPLGSWPRLGPCSDLRSLYPNVRNVRPPSIVPGCRPLTVSSCVPPTVHDPNTRALTSVDHDIRSPASSHGAPPLTRGPNAYHVMESGFRPPAFRPNVRPLAPEPGVHSLASRPGVRLPVIGPNTRISGLGPSIRPSSAGLGINPPAPRHGVCPPDMDPNTRPPMMAPNTRPPMMAPNTRPPMTGPNTRPPMTDPNTRTPMAGPNTRPPMTGPNTRPPMTGPNTRPPMSGPNTRPHMMGPNTRPAMMGPVNKQLVSGSGIRPSLGPIANAGPSRNSFSYSTTGFNGRPPLRPNDGLSTSSGHYPVPASLRQSFQQPQGLRVRPPLGCIPPPPPPGTSLGDPYGGAAIRPSNSAGALSYSGISRGAQINKPSDAGVGWNSSSSAVGHKAGTGYEKYDPFAEDSSDSKKRYRSRSQSPSQGFMRSSSSAGKEVGKKFRPDGDHRAPLSTSLTSEEESRMRTELEVEFKTYETSPELHPNYSEHREVFMDLYEEKMGHKEGSSLEQEWSTVWKRVLADLMEEEFSERKNALIAAKTNRASRSAAHAISSTSNSHNASQKYDNETSRNKWAAESSSDYYCEQSNYDNSVGYAANKESYGTSAEYGDAQKMYDREGRDQAGAGVSSYDSSSNYQSWDAKKGRESQMYYNSSRPDDKDGNGSEQHWHHPDLDPATLAERTRGLSTMEVAVLIKQLLKDKNIPQPEQMFKKIYSAVSDLHLKYVEEQLSM
ncbi:hypothetical protein FHG87_006439 [Trinorchestia longiramus]|nr:hypothetical protein FHG87_006439 [Trinorchestia longiramus]